MPKTQLIKDHHLWTRDTIKNISGDVTLDIAGDITLDAGGGDLIISGADVKIDATNKLYLDGGGDTYIQEGSADSMLFKVGDDNLFQLIEDGASGNTAWFRQSCAGFTQIEETFSGDDLLASGSGTGGTHDTHIDFRHSNKIYLEITATMNDMNLIFPPISGNFMLIVDYDGDWGIDSWKVWVHLLSAATSANVLWPGGTEPATTNNGKDIFSFYWDATNQICYGVASLDFQAGD